MSKNNTPEGKKKGIFPRSRIIFFVFAAIFFGLVIFYISSIKKDIQLLKKVEIPWLIVAILSELITYLFSALIYRQLLKIFNAGKTLSIWQLYKASIVALFTDQVIPSGGISGNGFIFNYFSKRNIPAADAFSIVVLQLLTYYSAIEILIIAVGSLSAFVYHLSNVLLMILAAGLAGYFLFAWLITFLGKKETVGKLRKKLGKIKWIRKYIERLAKQFSGETLPAEMSNPWIYFSKHKTIIATVILCQMAVYAIDAVTICALFAGLGVGISFMPAFIAYLLTRIISLLPISPGSLILYESGMTFFLTQLGAPVGTSIIVTLLFRFISFWMPMPIGFVLYRKMTT